jgi:hypothetical protein
MHRTASDAQSVAIVGQTNPTTVTTDVAIAADRDFWPSLLMAAAITSIAVGIIWDISWHETIGRDTFWTPAHLAIYLGGVLAGCTAGWLAIEHTFFAGQAGRDSSVSLFGARAPLGAWVAIWGALAMITSAPFDNWWHNAYGLDVKIISPPHAVLGLGMLGISAGVLLLVLSRQNRLHQSSKKGSGLFIYTGGVFVLLGSVFLLEYIFPNEQHGGMFYFVCVLMFPARFVALSCAGRVSWPATRVAAVYMGLLCGVDWILTLFPAHPKLAPIFNPVTHMVALPFPLLLIFPAMAVDLVLWKTRETRGLLSLVAIAIVSGTLFLAVFIPVQWFSSEFLISPRAHNWFFMGDRIWGYGETVGDWRNQFWRQDPHSDDADLLTFKSVVISWAIAMIGSGIGLFFGRWMRKVCR